MHDNVELTLASKRDEDISTHKFLEAFAADTLPSNIPNFCCLVMNTDEISKSGRRLVCIINRNNHRYYFDSYGLSPLKWHRTQKWRNLLDYEKSCTSYQHDNREVCVDYCIFILK